jgi:prevent-host-death family protein
MIKTTISDARSSLSDLINKVFYSGERVIINRNGTDRAALISINEFKILENFLSKIENEIDIGESEKALKEAEQTGTISHRQLKKEIGLI